MRILSVNIGSSSAKLALFVCSQLKVEPLQSIWSGEAKFDSNESDEAVFNALKETLTSLWEGPGAILRGPSDVDVIGHRVVHGGDIYQDSARIDSKVKDDIRRLEEFAPIHNRLNLAGIVSIEKIFGSDTPQIAVFDTTFHRTIPDVAACYPGPYEWFSQLGIRRHGFHGISHQYSTRRAAELLGCKIGEFTGLICHLGSGCSLTAVQNGKSIDTTMGFTPLEGVMMGTRSGSIDPGLILYLLRGKETVDSLDHKLNHESGLSGISGLENNMRKIYSEATAGNQRAKLALDMFIYRLQSYASSMLIHLTAPRAIVFTGGIGEHCSYVREPVCAALVPFGAVLDTRQNNIGTGDREISLQTANLKAFVIEAREDLEIATQCAAYFATRSSQRS